MADFREELNALLQAVGDDVIDVNDGLRFQNALNRARAALAEDAVGPSGEDFAAWLEREMPAGTVIGNPRWWARRIFARFGRAPASPPADGEVAELAKWLRANIPGIYRPAARAADLLEQFAARSGAELPPRVGHILRLAEIIREVDGNHSLGATALAEAILNHPEASGCGLGATLPRPVPVSERLPEAVAKELKAACAKFPDWPTDSLHAVAIVTEEVGELMAAILQVTYEPGKATHADVLKEAVQVATVALRFIASLDRYIYADDCNTHPQAGVDSAPLPEVTE